HETPFAERHAFHATLFATQVAYVNEVDLLEALKIVIEVSASVRFVFYPLDLMPDITLFPARAKLDEIANEVVFPAVREILVAKQLDTDLDFTLPLPTASTPVRPTRFAPIIRTQPDERDLARPASREILHRYWTAAKERRPLQDDEFKIPKYVVD